MNEKQYDNNMRGVLFKNDQGNNPKRPQYRGSITIDNVDYNLSAWIKESKKTGDKFMSLSAELKKDTPVKPKQAKVLTEKNWVDDDLNF